METKNFSFHTAKESFKDGIEVNRAKMFLYDINEAESIRALLEENGIFIDTDAFLAEYQKRYDFENMMREICDRHEDALDRLSEKGELFDDDCVFLYLNKLVRETLDVRFVPDPDFLSTEGFEGLENAEEEEKTAYYHKLLKAMNLLQKYHGSNLHQMFEPCMFDPEDAMIMATIDGAMDADLEMEEAYEIADELLEFADSYELFGPEEFYAFAIELLAKFSYEDALALMEKSREIFPEHAVRFFAAIILEIGYSIDRREPRLMGLIDIALRHEALTAEDEDYQGLIRQVKEYLSGTDNLLN